MIDLKYALMIEVTEDLNFFGFYSPDLEGFSGVGHSIEDCLYKAKWGMVEHLDVMKEMNLPLPAPNADPTGIIKNEKLLAAADNSLTLY
jgi:predicted RNase H-like HicB family nuclease